MISSISVSRSMPGPKDSPVPCAFTLVAGAARRAAIAARATPLRRQQPILREALLSGDRSEWARRLKSVTPDRCRYAPAALTLASQAPLRHQPRRGVAGGATIS